MDTFGEWLRQQRAQLKLTRKEFADRVGCSIALLRKIESGERRPSVQIAELIANCLNIPPEERSTFVRVARGELRVDRLPPIVEPETGLPYSASEIPRSNLPQISTPLIGRKREVERIYQLMTEPQCRLLTLVGPGGVGKTRLAISAAERLQDVFAGGVYFVPFAPVRESRFIVPVIANALGFGFDRASRSDPKTQLFHYLKEKQVLLLIDNLEHLLAGPGVEVLAELVANAPQVKLLATSRQSLELHDEWVFEVQGLPVPDRVDSKDSVQATAVELFVQRARRAQVGFSPTSADYLSIIRICQRVDGMPLAVELAAAWVRTLSCEEIAQEIERGLDFLSGPVRDLPARHHSIRAVFDHSWKLLSEEERGALRKLSAFQGGFSPQAAEIVTGARLPTLSRLVTKSLLRRSSPGRFDLHELVRQFAAEKLAADPEEQAATRAGHGRYFLGYFGQASDRLQSPAQREALAELAAEMDNFRAAWDWAVANGEFTLIEPALRSFVLFIDIHGRYLEGLDMLDRAIAALEAADPLSAPGREAHLALGHLLACQGLLSFRLAKHGQAEEILERSLDILRPLNQPRVLVEALTFLGIVEGALGNYAKALVHFAEGQEIASQIGDRWIAALCRISRLDLRGVVQGMMDPLDAYERFQSALADARQAGDPRLTVIGLNALSLSALRIGRYEEARLALEESVERSASVGDRWGQSFAYRGLGIIAQAQNEHNRAVEWFGKSLEMLTDLGARQDVGRVLVEMSRSVFALGNDAEARRLCLEALRIAAETGGAYIAPEALVLLASLQAKQGERERALEYLWVVLNHSATIQDTRDRAGRLRIELEGQLTDRQIETVLARAQEKTLESIVEDILKQG